ncbi:MAG: type II secretion system GspH family protein [Synergistaceae bacterium]|jgi:prepilin-type N-terminal cleavage/methylation domain-containing protein|nr:type II secretion system GspH family protein [Synergistaceae bacterium]
MRRKNAFTLVEIMIALAIAGIILAAGIAPLLYTSRLIASTREEFANANRERAAVGRIFQDVREASLLNSASPLRIVAADTLASGENDLLIVWTMTPSYTLRPMGSVVWGVAGKSTLNDGLAGGIYRLVISEDIEPASVKREELDFSKAALMLPDAKGITFSALDDSEWKKEYSGASPRALRVTIIHESGEMIYEDILPNF